MPLLRSHRSLRAIRTALLAGLLLDGHGPRSPTASALGPLPAVQEPARSGGRARRGPAGADDPRRQDRPDDPGRAPGGRRRPMPPPHRLGSVLSGGGSAPTPNTPAGLGRHVRRLQRGALATPLQIPLIYGVDAVHGHNNVLGATIFPHNIGLGATRDPALVEQIGAGHRRGGRRHRRRLGLRAVPVRRPRRPLGPHLRVLRRGPRQRRRDATIIDGLQGARSDGPRRSWPPPSTSSATAAPPAATTRATPRSARPSCARSTCRRSGPRSSEGVGSVMVSYNSWNGVKTARQQVPDHRRAQGRARLPRLRRVRLGRHRPDRRPARGSPPAEVSQRGQRRHRHGHGPLRLPDSSSTPARRGRRTATSRCPASTTPSGGS